MVNLALHHHQLFHNIVFKTNKTVSNLLSELVCNKEKIIT
jgi:hypothetical protein